MSESLSEVQLDDALGWADDVHAPDDIVAGAMRDSIRKLVAEVRRLRAELAEADAEVCRMHAREKA